MIAQKNSRNLRARFSFPIHLLMAWEMSGHGLSNFDEGISCPRNEAVCVCGETCMAGKSFIPISFSNLSASHPQRLSAPKICIFRSITKKRRRDAHVFIESCSKMTLGSRIKTIIPPCTQRTAIYRYNSMFCIVT